MRTRAWIAAGSLFALCGVALSAAGAYAYYFASTRADVIAVGVHIAGVDVGGLHAAQARGLLADRLTHRLRRSVAVVAGAHRFTIHPRSAGVRVDIAEMVDAAVQASRSGNLVHRFIRDAGGQPLKETIPLQAGLSRAHVARLVDRIARVIDRPAHNARV